jgi:hypothetical protein
MECCGRVSKTHCHCARCHQTFATLTSFDGHLVHEQGSAEIIACVPPRVLALVQDSQGVWRTPEGLARRDQDAARLASIGEAKAAIGAGDAATAA